MARTKSKSYRSVLTAIIGEEASPEALVKPVHGRTMKKHGRGTVKAALTGAFSKTNLTAFRQLKETNYLIERRIGECRKKPAVPCKEHAATAIIAWTGVGMKAFATADCLVGWCGPRPRNDVSNGYYKSRKVTNL